MKEYIQSVLNDKTYTKRERQREFDELLWDRLHFHKFDECKLLVAAGAKINNPFYENHYGDVMQIKFMIDNNLISPDIKDKQGMNLYSYAERAYFVTRKNRYKQVCDYLEFKGVEKIKFSDEQKEFLLKKFKEKCEYVGRVKCGEIEEPDTLEFKFMKLEVKYGMINYGVLKDFKENDKIDSRQKN